MDVDVIDAFFFSDETEQYYITGWTIRLSERSGGTDFDTVMRHHEYILVKVVAGLGGEDILQRDTPSFK